MTPTSEEMQQASAAKDQVKAAALQAMTDHGYSPSASPMFLIGVLLDLAYEHSAQRSDIGIEMVRSGFAILGFNADVSILQGAAATPKPNSLRH